MTQYLFAPLKAKISIFIFHGDSPYNIIHCHEVKADPNNLIKLKALYQTLFCMTSTILHEGRGGAGFLATTGVPIKVLKLQGDYFLCTLHCRQRQKSSF